MSGINLDEAFQSDSDRLDASSLTEQKVIKVTKVEPYRDNGKVRLKVNFEGDEGKPFIPCLTMAQLLAKCWSKDIKTWKGRFIRVFCDTSVMYAGEKIGGVRINGLSDIKESFTYVCRKGRKGVNKYEIEKLKNTDSKTSNKNEDKLSKRDDKVENTNSNANHSSASIKYSSIAAQNLSKAIKEGMPKIEGDCILDKLKKVQNNVIPKLEKAKRISRQEASCLQNEVALRMKDDDVEPPLKDDEVPF